MRVHILNIWVFPICSCLIYGKLGKIFNLKEYGTLKSMMFNKSSDSLNHQHMRPRSEVIKLFSFSTLTQLSTKFILLINVKMPEIVGILTFISMINTTCERPKARNWFICCNFSFMSSWNFVLSWVWKKFYNLGNKKNPLGSFAIIWLRRERWLLYFYCLLMSCDC